MGALEVGALARFEDWLVLFASLTVARFAASSIIGRGAEAGLDLRRGCRVVGILIATAASELGTRAWGRTIFGAEGIAIGVELVRSILIEIAASRAVGSSC